MPTKLQLSGLFILFFEQKLNIRIKTLSNFCTEIFVSIVDHNIDAIVKNKQIFLTVI